MAKKNKNKPSKNGTKAAARDATAPKPSRSSIYAAAAIAASSTSMRDTCVETMVMVAAVLVVADGYCGGSVVEGTLRH